MVIIPDKVELITGVVPPDYKIKIFIKYKLFNLINYKTKFTKKILVLIKNDIWIGLDIILLKINFQIFIK